ncbi:kinase-like domain-containing protein [Favolaschia claudopus]|uniref:non-specific serine/threonine protein kinase n=1 Tax=Favolaschia claudopus TaxID=2862362 RepID=A0AAW0E0M0_9AGAR
MSRIHADVNARLGASWYDYENFRIDWRVGGGKYSEEWTMANNERCILKILKPVAAKKVKREIKVLRNLTGGPNIIPLLDVVRDPSCRYHSLEYVDNVDWRRLLPILTEADINITPSSFYWRSPTWGLAEFYHPETDYHIRVGSRYYKSPELLVGYKRYDYSLDMWSTGSLDLTILGGSDNDDQLLKIMKTLGTEDFDVYLKNYNIHFETDVDDLLVVYDHGTGFLAKEAQAHHISLPLDAVRLEVISTRAESVSDSGFAST